ncbi:MAG TPA: hypothetical protein VHP11_13275 [Tepidisphaeraceae bacterium]|nr:hypothetical protein [Tepidisphaeraceae bacterium]
MDSDPSDRKTADSPSSLTYAPRSDYVTHRQFNLLLLLLLLNTFLFSAFVCLPAVSPAIKQSWADYQARKAAREQERQRQASIQTCLNFARPPETVVYTEDPKEAAALLASSSVVKPLAYSASDAHYRQFSVQVSACRTGSDVLGPSQTDAQTELNVNLRLNEDAALVFLHRMKTPAGEDRLVWIRLQALQSSRDVRPGSLNPDAGMQISRSLVAYVVPPDLQDRRSWNPMVLRIVPSDSDWIRLPRTSPNTPEASLTVEHSTPWRVFAGQIDPNDPSHLTIPYEIAGQRYTLDARLNNGDRLVFTPQQGRVLPGSRSNELTWQLNSPPTPQTQPIAS